MLHVVGLLLGFTSLGMVASGTVSLLYSEPEAGPLFGAALLTGAFGAALARLTTFRDELGPREGFAIVTFSWFGVGLFGALPYRFTGSIEGFIPAVFESMSGYTTTGATVVSDIEALSHGVLFWRALTHWMGGMGIIVLVIAVLPFLGVGGVQLFRAEVPGPTTERLRPRMTQTAKLLWGVYAGLTLAQTVLFMLGGVNLFESVTHAFATLATGGFSTRNQSLAAFDSVYIHYVTILFMYLAGVNFALHLKAASGTPRIYLKDLEWQFYTALFLGAGVLLTVINLVSGRYGTTPTGVEGAFRDSLFQTISIITTTGFVSANYETWAAAGLAVILALMFTGGMAGSTSGGIKSVRLLLLLEHTQAILRKHVHPRAVTVLRLGRSVVPEGVMANVLGFLTLYVLLIMGGMLALSLLGMDVQTAFGASVATVGNIGPGIGGVGPVENYGWITDPSLIVLTFLMLVGRLEIFTVILLFHPEFWRSARRGNAKKSDGHRVPNRRSPASPRPGTM